MKVIDILKLIRYKNLLIIILTQYLMRYCVIYPFLDSINYEPQFPGLNFLMLVLATVLIAAAGYAINDYFDIKVDMANHPDSVVVGTRISRFTAMTYNNVFNFAGVVLGFIISYSIGIYQLGFIFVLISGGLWFYSAIYKKQLITGNIIVALFAAFVPLLTVVYEIPLLNKMITPDRPPVETTVVSVIFLYVAGFSVFAFLTTLAREILKDIEDIEGDRLNERRTIPVSWGVNTARYIVTTLLTIIVASVIFIWFAFFMDVISLIYILLFVVIPLIFLVFRLIKAKEKKHFHFVSIGIKGIMLSGLLFSVLLWFII